MERLTKKEEQIMLIIWDLQKAFVKEIIKELPDPETPYNTISSIVRLLVEKGYLGFKAYGKTHEYYPLISLGDYRRSYMKNVVKNYFSDSYKNVISMFAKDEKISIKELKEIIELIENSKQEGNE